MLYHIANVLQRLEIVGVYGAELHNLVIHLQTLQREEKWKTRLEVKCASGVPYPSVPNSMPRSRACFLQGTTASAKQNSRGFRHLIQERGVLDN